LTDRSLPWDDRPVPTSLSPALAEAHDANYAEFSTGYARRPGSDLHRDAAFDRAIIDLPALPFNGVFRSRLAPGDVARVADETLSLAAVRRVPAAWRVTPTTPPATTAALEAHGWLAERLVPVMAIDLGTERSLGDVPRGVTVEEVTAATLGEWSRVVAVAFGCPEEYVHGPATYDRAFGLPGETTMRRFLSRRNGEPVAASAVLPGPPGTGLAGIFSVATLEPVRGQGLGGVMTRAAMDAAREAGAAVAVLQASDMGRPVYQRLGFDTVAHITVHLPPAGGSSTAGL
jgi:GNAT superfamily N-acetyltransferase